MRSRRIALLAISLLACPDSVVFGYPPTPNDLFDFAADWGEPGKRPSELLSLLRGDQPVPTASPTATPTASRTATSSPTPTLTATEISGPVINSLSPRVANVGDLVTVNGTGFGTGQVQVDVGSTVINGNASNGTTVQFIMPAVTGMDFNIH